jgi:hypothetical protein
MSPRPSDDNVMKTRAITVPPPSYRRPARLAAISKPDELLVQPRRA